MEVVLPSSVNCLLSRSTARGVVAVLRRCGQGGVNCLGKEETNGKDTRCGPEHRHRARRVAQRPPGWACVWICSAHTGRRYDLCARTALCPAGNSMACWRTIRRQHQHPEPCRPPTGEPQRDTRHRPTTAKRRGLRPNRWADSSARITSQRTTTCNMWLVWLHDGTCPNLSVHATRPEQDQKWPPTSCVQT